MLGYSRTSWVGWSYHFAGEDIFKVYFFSPGSEDHPCFGSARNHRLHLRVPNSYLAVGCGTHRLVDERVESLFSVPTSVKSPAVDFW